MYHGEEGRVYECAIVHKEEDPEIIIIYGGSVDARNNKTDETRGVGNDEKHDDGHHGDDCVSFCLSFLPANFLAVLARVQAVVHFTARRLFVVTDGDGEFAGSRVVVGRWMEVFNSSSSYTRFSGGSFEQLKLGCLDLSNFNTEPGNNFNMKPGLS